MENLAFKNEDRYEMIDGKVVMMSPRPATNHGIISGNIYHIFRKYLQGKKCRAFMDGHELHLDEKNSLVPDAMIVCNKEMIKSDGIHGVPDLVVEVLSPSTAARDKGVKKDLYEKFGVKEYWIASPGDKSIEVHLLRNGKFDLDNIYTVYPDWQWSKMSEEEKAAAALSFRVSLYDDVVVDVREIFENVE